MAPPRTPPPPAAEDAEGFRSPPFEKGGLGGIFLQPAVEALARRLRDEDALRVFFDQWELIPGEPWQEPLERALDASRTCAVFLGPEGLGPWHSAEMRVALGQRIADEPKRVIPVLLPQTANDALPALVAPRPPKTTPVPPSTPHPRGFQRPSRAGSPAALVHHMPMAIQVLRDLARESQPKLIGLRIERSAGRLRRARRAAGPERPGGVREPLTPASPQGERVAPLSVG